MPGPIVRRPWSRSSSWRGVVLRPERGSRMPMRAAMIAITISNSISVKGRSAAFKSHSCANLSEQKCNSKPFALQCLAVRIVRSSSVSTRPRTRGADAESVTLPNSVTSPLRSVEFVFFDGGHGSTQARALDNRPRPSAESAGHPSRKAPARVTETSRRRLGIGTSQSRFRRRAVLSRRDSWADRKTAAVSCS